MKGLRRKGRCHEIPLLVTKSNLLNHLVVDTKKLRDCSGALAIDRKLVIKMAHPHHH